ncbi:MAG: hypothetical protein AAFO91_11140 [Bacteroidota bacterium]
MDTRAIRKIGDEKHALARLEVKRAELLKDLGKNLDEAKQRLEKIESHYEDIIRTLESAAK